MLQTCEQLAAGLGAPPTKGASATQNAKSTPVVVGNAPLGLWVGERFLGESAPHHIRCLVALNVPSTSVAELFKRAGKEARVQKQTAVNAQLTKAVSDLARRGLAALAKTQVSAPCP